MDVAELRSEVRNFAAGALIPFPTQFLEPGRRYVSPCITDFDIILSLNVTTAAANILLARDIPTALQKIQITDSTGDRVNLRGSSLRIVDQYEFGASYNDGPNVPASTTTTVVVVLRVTFAPYKSRRRHDFFIPLDEFLDGGALNINCGSATINGVAGNTATINSGSIQWIARLVEDRERELKSRMAYIDYDITLREASYSAQGLLRHMLMFSGEVGQFNARNWGAQNITSRTLDLSIMPDVLLRDRYKQEWPTRQADPAGATVAEDATALSQCIPVFTVRQDQKLVQLPDIQTCHVQFDGTLPASTDLPKMIVCSVTDRAVAGAMRTMKARSPGHLASALNNLGYVKTQNGNVHALGNWPDSLQRKMPIKLATDRNVFRQLQNSKNKNKK